VTAETDPVGALFIDCMRKFFAETWAWGWFKVSGAHTQSKLN